MRTVAVIMTCYNRKEKTYNCLNTILKCSNPNIKIDVFLTNDGSTDGTAEMIQECFPEVNMLMADGSLFWNKGMYKSFEAASKIGYDFYLWVNDDVVFDENIIPRLVEYFDVVKKKEETIIVGYTENKSRDEVTYAGFCKKK